MTLPTAPAERHRAVSAEVTALMEVTEGAKRLGMHTAWVTDSKRAHAAVDYVLDSVHDLERSDAGRNSAAVADSTPSVAA